MQNIIINNSLIAKTNSKDERKEYVKKLYSYITEIIIPEINNENLFADTINEVVYNFISYEREFDLKAEIVYKMHLNIINRIFNAYLFKKYDITNQFNVILEDEFYPLMTSSIVNFSINYCNSYFSPNNYKISINSNIDLLIPDYIHKIKGMNIGQIMSIDESEFSKIKRQFECFYIKYNALIKNIEEEVDKLNKFCNFNFNLNIYENIKCTYFS